MEKLVYISDFFVHEINGGAEICDDVLLQELFAKNIQIVKIKSMQLTAKHILHYIQNDYNFLISNFIGLSEECKKTLQVYKKRYSIMEHDHKYLITRNPIYYKDFLAPEEHIINREFYENANYVFCQSQKHADVVKQNIKTSNIINLGCSLWSDQQLQLIRQYCNNEKNDKSVILSSSNPIKGFEEAIKYCKENTINFSILETLAYDQFILELSKYNQIVMFPESLETFNRTLLEARMLNIKVVTNSFNGCTYEDWFKSLKGNLLIDFVQKKRSEIVELIKAKVFENNTANQQQGDITVILNCYRRPYNLKMQIDAINSQTIKPKQIWLWINDHEDNRDFDFSTIKIDRIFKNNYNWKFYGRFAAALLCDTKFISVYDDDTIPGSKWHENCLNTMKESQGILGSAGVILNSSTYSDHQRCGWPTQNDQTTEVDLVGHAWFFKREWLQHLWKEKPFTWDNGEDIQFSYMAKVHAGIKTYCPPHPRNDKELHGSILGNELGIDNKATSNNNIVSHQQFFTQRDLCVQNGIRNGWKTVNGVKA